MYFEQISAAFKNRGDQEELVCRTLNYYEDSLKRIEEFKGNYPTDGLAFSALFKYFVDYMVQYIGEKEVNVSSVTKGVLSMLSEYYNTEDELFNKRMNTIVPSLEKIFNDSASGGVDTIYKMLNTFCVEEKINPLYLLICYDNKAHEILG